MRFKGLSMSLLAAAVLTQTTWAKAPNAPSNEVLSKPLFAEKMIVAHNMTHIIRNGEFGSMDQTGPKELYYPSGITKKMGGMYQVSSMPALMDWDADLDEAVKYELLAAKEMGLDGFQFFYPGAGSDQFLDRLDAIILAYFKVAKKLDMDFKFALSICNARRKGYTQAQMEERLGNRIKGLIANTGNDNHWLRSPDGRLVTFLWIPNNISDALGGKHWEAYKDPRLVDGVAQAWYNVSKHAGEEIAYVYHVQQPEVASNVDAILENFPAVWSWTGELGQDEAWAEVVKKAKALGRTYTQSVFPDYYTSKLYPAGGGRLILDPEVVNSKKAEEFERHAVSVGVTRPYQHWLQNAIDTDTNMINYITWNDFPEGHHLSPSVNHNFAFGVLMKYYKQVWKTGNKIPDHEAAMVFYKKYPLNAKPEKNVHVHYKAMEDNLAQEDNVEIVTLLKKPAEVFYNGVKVGDGVAGINTFATPMKVGKVNVTVKRDKKDILALTAPIKITDKPYRTDRVTVGYSTDHDQYFEKLFGKKARLPKIVDSDGSLVEAG